MKIKNKIKVTKETHDFAKRSSNNVRISTEKANQKIRFSPHVIFKTQIFFVNYCYVSSEMFHYLLLVCA